ncbi:MAG: hypothetical protein MUO22_06360, partial [Sedimentisphaerales bacterium]|nr:hypothetical protein [Sedimentisphaerales bacterium]
MLRNFLFVSFVCLFCAGTAFGQPDANVHALFWWSDQDPNDHYWHSPGNWWPEGAGVPGPNDFALIGAGEQWIEYPPELWTLENSGLIDDPVIEAGQHAECWGLMGPGGVADETPKLDWKLTLEEGATLTVHGSEEYDYYGEWHIGGDRWAGATGFPSGTIDMNNGTINVTHDIYMGCWEGTGIFNMTGGTVNVWGLSCPHDWGSAVMRLHGGTINVAGWFYMDDIYEDLYGTPSLIDVTEGKLVVNGDFVELISEYIIVKGWIVAYDESEPGVSYDGHGQLTLAYDGNQTTLSAVLMDPRTAYDPTPINYLRDASLYPQLGWSAGDDAVSHDLYVGTDFDEVNEADTSTIDVFVRNQTPTSYDTSLLDVNLGHTYYWRVDEVDSLAQVHRGMVWTFTIKDYVAVEDFDSYTNENELLNVWSDGETNPSASIVYLELGEVRSGKSMKFAYYNDGYYAYYSLTDAGITDLGFGPDWTLGGIKSMSLWFHGDEYNILTPYDKMWIALEDSTTKVSVDYDDMNDILEDEWQEWYIDLQDFADGGLDLSDVQRIYIGIGHEDNTETGGEGFVYFDDLALYTDRCIPEYERQTGSFNGDCVIDYNDLLTMGRDWLVTGGWITAEFPNDIDPLTWFHFDEGSGSIVNDIANGRDGELGPDDSAPAWVTPGAPTSEDYALEFDGFDDYVTISPLCFGPEDVCDHNANIMIPPQFTMAAWIKIPEEQTIMMPGIVVARDDVERATGLCMGTTSNWQPTNELSYVWDDYYWNWNSDLWVEPDLWAFVALTLDPDGATLFLYQDEELLWARNE